MAGDSNLSDMLTKLIREQEGSESNEGEQITEEDDHNSPQLPTHGSYLSKNRDLGAEEKE